MVKLQPVTARSRIDLSDAAAVLDGVPRAKAKTKQATAKQTDRISELQRVFYADARYALLIILQGRDAAGKDGTIRKVFTAVNPQGCTVTSFKEPTPLERSHDFLWRVHAAVPARGMIGIFNRSHYEDVLVPRVHEQLSAEECATRYREIVDFERMLVEQRVIILKFMLHISRDEQRRRLQERLTDPEKRWKFRQSDLDDRRMWDAYTDAYRDMLTATSTKQAPWYVVPAEDKKVRNRLVSRTIADTLEGLKLGYPAPLPGIEHATIE
jgi:PPK2 family polyphosphate:nucleotide phosphotransferase